MPIESDYDEATNVLHVTISGSVDDEAFLGYIREHATGSHAPSGAWDLFDFRTMRGSFSQQTLKEIASLLSRGDGEPSQDRVAIVVATDLGFGVSRQYQTYRETELSPDVRVFRDYDEARKWLGIG